jgi:hypothetical protein
MNKWIDSLNGEENDGYGRKKKLYINYENAHGELKKMRGVSRKVDDLGAKVNCDQSLTLSANHWPVGTVAAIGNACHGIASIIIMITSLIPVFICARMFNADNNENTFAAIKERAQICNMKAVMIGLSIITAQRIKKFQDSIKSRFQSTKKPNTKRDRFTVVNFSRNTNCTVNDDDNDDDRDNNDKNHAENEIEVKFRRRNKARKLEGTDVDSYDTSLTGSSRFARSYNTASMAAENVVITKKKI